MAQAIQSQREAEAYKQLVSKVEEDYDEVIDEYAPVYLVATGDWWRSPGGWWWRRRQLRILLPIEVGSPLSS